MSDDITTADVLRVYGKDAAVAYVNLCDKIDALVAERDAALARAVPEGWYVRWQGRFSGERVPVLIRAYGPDTKTGGNRA